jgi:hypothetical protein
MQNLDKILEYINKSNIIIIISKSNNVDSKIMLDNVYKYIYNKYPGDKCICKPKGFLKKIKILKDKLIRIDTCLDKIQFSSSNNNFRLRQDFECVQANSIDNNCKMIFKIYNSNISTIYLYSADLIIGVKENDCSIIKNRYSYENDIIFDINFLRRKSKLQKLNFIDKNN